MTNTLTPTTISAHRKRLGLTQLQLAGKLIGATDAEIERARAIQSSLTLVRYWEHGTHEPGPDNTAKLHAIFSEKE